MAARAALARDLDRASEPAETLTVAEFAREVRVADKTVRRWLRDDWVKGIKLPGSTDRPHNHQWRIPRSELVRLLRLRAG